MSYMARRHSLRLLAAAERALRPAAPPLDALSSRDRCDTPFPSAWDRMHETQTRFRGELYGLPWT